MDELYKKLLKGYKKFTHDEISDLYFNSEPETIEQIGEDVKSIIEVENRKFCIEWVSTKYEPFFNKQPYEVKNDTK